MFEITFENTLLKPNSKYIPEIDQLKGIAIILVVIYHAGGVLGIHNYLYGQIGVDIFLILSGMSLTLGNLSLSWKEFFFRRFSKIMPTYWFALTLFILGGAFVLGIKYRLKDVLLHYSGLHGYADDQYFLSINDSFWFISLIILLYIVFYFVIPFIKKQDAGTILKIGLTLTIVVSYYLKDHGSGFNHLAVRIPDFFLGILIGLLLKNKTINIRFDFILIALCITQYYLGFLQTPFFVLYPFAGVVITCGYFALCSNSTKVMPFFNVIKNIIGFIGGISFEVYLIHQPLIREYNHYILSLLIPLGTTSKSVIVLGIIVMLLLVTLLGYLIYKYVNNTVKILSVVLTAPIILFSGWVGTPAQVYVQHLFNKLNDNKPEIVQIDNPNGVEDRGFWLGAGDTVIIIEARKPGRITFVGKFLSGPSLPETSIRYLQISSPLETVAIEISNSWKYQLHTFSINIPAGRTKIKIKSLDKPTLLQMPNGDTRPLLVRVRDFKISSFDAK